MCPAHHREAESVINRRLARANASNPDGWAAIADASLAIDRPHLPNGLAARLPTAEASIYLIPAPDELAERADAVVEAAGWFHGRSDDFAVALGQEPELTGEWPDWLVNLILDLGAAGLGSAAERVGDALGQVDPANRRSSTATSRSRWPSPAWPTRRATGSRPTWRAGRTISGFGCAPATHWPPSATPKEQESI